MENNEKIKNDLEDLLCIEAMRGEANLQLADPELVAYWKDNKNRVIYLFEDIDDHIMLYVKSIFRWNREDEEAGIPLDKRKKITIFINSYRGSVDSCFSLVQAMQLSKTPVVTINMAVSASAACIILMNGTKGYRYCMPMSWALVHQGSSASSGSYQMMESQQDNYRKIQEMMEKTILEHTNITAKEYKKIKTKENYFYAKEQIEKGIVDFIVEDINQIIL